jgi:hypothetical protein
MISTTFTMTTDTSVAFCKRSPANPIQLTLGEAMTRIAEMNKRFAR